MVLSLRKFKKFKIWLLSERHVQIIKGAFDYPNQFHRKYANWLANVPQIERAAFWLTSKIWTSYYKSTMSYHANLMIVHIKLLCKEAIRRLPCFIIDELKCALKQMASNRCPDSYGIVCEMVKFAPETFHFKFDDVINAMIDYGCSNNSWRTSLFCMLPKSGDMTLPENY